VNYSKGRSIKDLSTFDYPPERMVLVDNFISAFAIHRENGVPILPFYQGSEDTELIKLGEFIETKLIGKTDVRPILSSSFHTQMYHDIKDVRELVGHLQTEFKISEKS